MISGVKTHGNTIFLHPKHMVHSETHKVSYTIIILQSTFPYLYSLLL